MAKSFVAKKGVVSALALLSLTACTSVGNLLDSDRVDYKSAGKVKTSTLDIPPDLTQLSRDSRYAVPENNQGKVTASSYNLQKANAGTAAPVAATAAAVAPNALADMRIERDGSERWLVVKQSPEALWPQIKDFWQENGFLINVELPESGVMETDWAENRAKIPQDIIRDNLGKVLDGLYSTGERDKFRTRLERNAKGETEIYISHRGAQEVLVGAQKDSTTWTVRPTDPGLEAQFLTRLMTRLGSDADRAKTVTKAAADAPAVFHASLKKNADGNYVEVDEGFDRAWRRVGLALDRAGFTVEDRDRSKGLYFVRYIDQDAEAKAKGNDGFFAKLFSFGGDKAKDAPKYRVQVKDAGETSAVTVQNAEGKPDASAVPEKILNLLQEQLK